MMMSKQARQRGRGKFTAAASVLMLSAVGCGLSHETRMGFLEKVPFIGPDKEAELPKMGPTKVLTDATAVALELPESDLHSRERFRKRFGDLVENNRIAAADFLVARHPDHVHQVLSSQFIRDNKTFRVLAESYDRFCKNGDGWTSVIDSPATEAVDAYFEARAQLDGAITNGKFGETLSIDLIELAEATERSSLLVDACYQTGIARILRQENREAAEAFDMAAQVAGNRHGMHAAMSQLMCSESLRRAGDFAAATDRWRSAVEMASAQIRNHRVTDPTFWDRASYLKPVGTSWPDATSAAFAELGGSSANAIRTELLRQLAFTDPQGNSLPSACWVEAALASWKIARGESQNAIVHLKKAETLANNTAKDWLRIAQAPVLISLGQPGTATTLLAPIIAREDDSPAMLAAMSKLGVIKLTGSSQQHGVRLLHQAVHGENEIDWPGKSGARADLALGLLMIGETAEGLSQMRLAQQQFEADGDHEQLAQSLWNQRKYLEQSDGERKEIEAVSDRLAALHM